MTKDAALALLPKLKPAELEAVIAVANNLLSGAHTGGKQAAATPLAATFIAALSAALNLTGSHANLPPTVTKALDKRLPDTVAFFNEHFKGWDTKKVGQMAFLRMMFDALRDDLKRRGVAPNYTTMINNMPHLRRVFESQFPGYIDAGATEIIMRRFK